MRIKIITTMVLLCCLTACLSCWSYAYAAPDNLLLVFDRRETAAEFTQENARQYREFSELRASASGQFTADELPKILSAIPTTKQNIWIVDLRQESHGFIDGLPVSWVSDRNAANIDKNAFEIAREEKALLYNIGQQTTVTVHELKKLADGKVASDTSYLMIPDDVETEQELVHALGAKYARIYVLDHNKPSDEEVDRFIYFIKYKVKHGDWLHFHCRGGRGRSSTFLTMYDMIRNAPRLTFTEVMQRQAKIGSIQLDVMPSTINKIWKKDGAHERYLFLCEFYEYVVDPNGFAVRNWSSWRNFKAK